MPKIKQIPLIKHSTQVESAHTIKCDLETDMIWIFIYNQSMSISSSTVGGARTKYKIIFLGEQTVGKSSIIQKYLKDKFQEGLNPTVGIDFHIKNISRNGRHYRVQLWDTAGQQRFKSLIPNYMKDANCAVMVYDIAKKSSLQNLKLWNHMFQEHRTPQAIKVFVGNKIDLVEREITKKQGENYAAQFHSKHFQVSAKLGKGLDELFNSMLDLISENLEQRNKLPAIQEVNSPSKRSEQFANSPSKQLEEVKRQFGLNYKSGEGQQGQTKKKWNCC